MSIAVEKVISFAYAQALQFPAGWYSNFCPMTTPPAFGAVEFPIDHIILAGAGEVLSDSYVLSCQQTGCEYQDCKKKISPDHN